MSGFFRSEEGQGFIEFALILPPILLLLVFGLVELATVLSDSMTMQSASREGARVGSALVNGGGTLGCPPGTPGGSPNAASVDPTIIAAVERVLTGNGTKVTLSDVSQILIWKADANGNRITLQTNTWNYGLNAGPVVDGQALDFSQASQPWQPCSRNNVAPNADSVGITVIYTYKARTPLRMLVPFFSQFTMTDKTVMAMNAFR